MAYEYKTIMRRENHDFDYYKNRWNSKTSGVIAIGREDRSCVNVATVNNTTGEVTISESANEIFKKSTIDLLKEKLSL